MSGRNMKELSDSLLLQSYHKAIELNLSSDFINQIKDEMKERALSNHNDEHTSQVG
ncbi:sporulation histidine kinase inhibitor Sda [Halobacillus litoralis]|uniref:sporulation histidine kinase inhibitor Sda n=1 Tax=Halobacillus litoralis TaxID=45668 RepID=UPI001CD75BF4|nr:sporulation histidine kinase inhibitor Sda [Halobacillus litoralis]MCA0970004.1 sporulation histidine kinase inhibitor Sda [Halobacillus litoralis]